MMSHPDLLQRTVDIDQEAQAFGFKWDNPHQLMQKIQEEYQEVLAVIDDPTQQEALKDELGDLLHAVLSLCMVCKFSPQEVLGGALAKLKKRFDTMVAIAHADGYTDFNNSHDHPTMEIKLTYWRRAKEALE